MKRWNWLDKSLTTLFKGETGLCQRDYNVDCISKEYIVDWEVIYIQY